jgi:hypothetical protein
MNLPRPCRSVVKPPKDLLPVPLSHYPAVDVAEENQGALTGTP